MPDTTLSAAHADTWKTLLTLRQAACERLNLYREAKQSCKRAKEAYELAVAEVFALIDTEQDAVLPLFEAPTANGEEANPKVPDPAETYLAQVFEAAGLSEALTAALAARGFRTVGDVDAFLARDDGYGSPGEAPRKNLLTDVAGVGPVKAEKVAQALAHFRAGELELAADGDDGEGPDPVEDEE